MRPRGGRLIGRRDGECRDALKDDLDPGLEGRLPVPFERTGPNDDEPGLGGHLRHRPGQTRLADSSLAGDRDERASGVFGFREPPGDPGDIRFPSDECRSAPGSHPPPQRVGLRLGRPRVL